MAFLGISLTLYQYLVSIMHFSLPASANGVTNFIGAAFILALLGGYISDTWLNRFWTIVLSEIIEFVGYILILLSAAVSTLQPPPCSTSSSSCKEANASQKAVLFLGLYLIALGAGGVKSNLPTLGAEQFDKHERAGELAVSRYFNWYMFSISVGAFIAVTLVMYVTDNVSQKWGYSIVVAAMFLSAVFISSGFGLYRKQKHTASPLIQMGQVLVVAFRNRKLDLDLSENFYDVQSKDSEGKPYQIHRSEQFRCLDNAARLASGSSEAVAGERPSPWRICTVTQVEEVKVFIRLLPIFASTIIMNCAVAQMQTFFIAQGSTMDREVGAHFEIPAGSISFFPLLVQIVSLPLYDRFFVPLARRFTANPHGITHLQRSGVGLVFSTLSMMIAALVELKRIAVARDNSLLDNPSARIPIKIYWLIPQYLIFGLADTFTLVGLMEFFYSESPQIMRSMSTSLIYVSLALGNFLSSVLVSVINKTTRRGANHTGWLPDNINRSKLSNFYWLIAAINFLNFLCYLYWACWYKYSVEESQPISDQIEEAYNEEQDLTVRLQNRS
ncbi:hypothetical protein O6H91_06G024200 [Diphasiastrum complanatum]|nr:hypothetical protein O6H91_06G024200 [Diphasiastrum complanatum]KAJ7551671.1 hypothetical protein O6H91_06G024200 [Diphasiastrum complanatum]